MEKCWRKKEKMEGKNVKKPVVLITGYLGSGKTTLLNNILREETRRVALIVNDMGSINVDAKILGGANVTECPMFELQNGCICCTLREEFIGKLEEISSLGDVEAVFVEASGISDPGAVAASFLAYEEENPGTNVCLTSVVTVVDADRIYREFLGDMRRRRAGGADDSPDSNGLCAEEISTLVVDQIEFCTAIVLNKCDLLSESELSEVEAAVREFQPRAPIVRAVNGRVPVGKIVSSEPFDFEKIDSSSAIQKAINSLDESGRGCTDEYGITSFVFEERRPFNRGRFTEFVNGSYPASLIRAKGYIWFSDAGADVQLFEQAGRNTSVTEVSYWVDALSEEQKRNVLENNPEMREGWDEEFGDRMNQIVFIGRNYDQAEIRRRLEDCLDDKMSA